MAQFRGRLEIPGMEPPIEISDSTLADFAQRNLRAVEEAGRTYRYIAETKGTADFISEVSIDEANAPQTPVELFLILAAIAHAKIPIQTIAPKFTGSFLKGVDYVGDARQFDREFKDDLAVIAFAVKTFGLPKNLKLSVHTGSDKFSLYPLMRQAITAVDAGIHLKTAGTTWLEEAVGIASCGGEALQLAKDIYRESHCRFEELAKPYLAVISIDARRLPLPAAVDGWSADDFVHTLKHDESCAAYNSDFRQLMHIGFRIAAEMKPRFIKMLLECRDVIEEHVTSNLYENHIRRLYPGIQ